MGQFSMQEMAVFGSNFGANQHIGGKTDNKRGFSGHCAVICRRFRGARGEKQTKLTANGGGRDAKGRLFVLYSAASKANIKNLI